MTRHDLEEKVLALAPVERAKLVRKLIASLPIAVESAGTTWSRAWVREAERRLADFRSGTVKAVSARRVLQRARKKAS